MKRSSYIAHTKSIFYSLIQILDVTIAAAAGAGAQDTPSV